MPVISVPQAFNEEDLYVDLRPMLGQPLFLKCEGFNFAGSIKLKAATEMVESAERRGIIGRDSILVESSSGNLGVALSVIAASKGYRFFCVTDSRCNLATRLMMEALGSKVHVVSEGTAEGGLLGARLAFVRDLCAADPHCVWLSQYTNADNWKAHYYRTAPAIARGFPHLDVLFIGVGTTGTLMGCARWFRNWHRPVRIVAVDSVGSAIFGDPPGRRMIPGLGMSVRPAAARRGVRGRGGARRGGGHHPHLPQPGHAGLPLRRLHRHGGQRCEELARPARHPRPHPGGDRPGPR
ncbi:cysteine synthase [Streptomyces pristinaespiralis]